MPNLSHAATVSDQISVDTDDADQDGIGNDTKVNNNPLKIGLNQYIGLRFVGHGLPDTAFILSASIRFTAESAQTANQEYKASAPPSAVTSDRLAVRILL